MAKDDRLSLTLNADGSTTLRSKKTGEYMGSLASPANREAPTPSPSFVNPKENDRLLGDGLDVFENRVYLEPLSTQAKIDLASNSDSSSVLLITLAENYIETRPAVAKNPSTSAYVLKELTFLSKDSDSPDDLEAVRAITLHDNTSQLVFAELVRHPDVEVRSNIAGRQDVNPYILNQLRRDKSDVVLRALENNPKRLIY